MFDHKRAYKLRNHQLTRAENSKLLFNLIHAHDGISRVELVRLTGLSPSTVSSLVDELVRMRLVTERGHTRMPSGAGRRPISLNICSSGRQIPVFSLSRSGVRYTLFDLGFNVIEQLFYPCEAEADASYTLPVDAGAAKTRGKRYIGIIEEILAGRAEKLDRDSADAVLVSYPGFYITEEQVYVLPSLQTAFLREEIEALEGRLGKPVFMGNSSMSLAYAEKKHREAEGEHLENLIYINICEGVGAGIICDGEMFMRPDRIAGEIGHITVETGGKPCACGNCGCLECYANQEAIVRSVCEAMAGEPEAKNIALCGTGAGGPTMEEIGRAYDAGVRSVCTALDGIADKLFVGVCNTVNITGIRSIVIGGIEGLGEGFLKKLRALSESSGCRMLMRGVSIQYPRTGAQADSIGIARYFIDKIFRIKGGHDLPDAAQGSRHKP